MKNIIDQNNSKKYRELRKQNIKLKRELRQVRKRCNRLELNSVIEADMEDEETSELKNKDRLDCPRCGSGEYEEFSAGRYDFYKCVECGSGRKQTA